MKVILLFALFGVGFAMPAYLRPSVMEFLTKDEFVKLTRSQKTNEDQGILPYKKVVELGLNPKILRHLSLQKIQDLKQIGLNEDYMQELSRLNECGFTIPQLLAIQHGVKATEIVREDLGRFQELKRYSLEKQLRTAGLKRVIWDLIRLDGDNVVDQVKGLLNAGMSNEFMIRDLIEFYRNNVVEQAKGLLDAGMKNEIVIRDLIRLNRDNVVEQAKGLLNAGMENEIVIRDLIKLNKMKES